jgi:hypothetical protein
MPLEVPNLDDRSFEDLLEEAKARVRQTAPAWTDLNASDPGIALLDVFAFLTDLMIYRLNRVPEKAYIEFLRLIGVRLHPPAAASVALRFTRADGFRGRVVIPRGTRVTTNRAASGSDAPVFVTDEQATLANDADEITVTARHCEIVEAEDRGLATGVPGQSVAIRRPPIIAPTGDPLDLVVGVEARAAELGEQERGIEHKRKSYRIWREVENFTDLGPDRNAYVADRTVGIVTFAPAARVEGADARLTDEPVALAAVPARGRQIRVWYRRGGGPDGNVAAESLTVLKDPMPGLEVTNPLPATGGRAGESLENARLRGPQELHTLSRAVTARDYQLVAERSSGAVERALATTQAALWKHAKPGTVEVVVVPSLPEGRDPAGVTAQELQTLQSEPARVQVQGALDERRPLGTQCLVTWAGYKTVRVQARIVVQREEDLAAVRQRVDARLHEAINPLRTEQSPSGWGFGQSLYVSNIYKIILSEPGVRYVKGVQLIVDEVPGTAITELAADPFKDGTWFAGSEDRVFRTLNDADGWEAVARFEQELIVRITPHLGIPGLIALATRPEGGGSRVYISRDTGTEWELVQPAGFAVQDLAWMDRDGAPILLMATDVGLYELPAGRGAETVQLEVDPKDKDLGISAIAVSRLVRGAQNIAVAVEGTGGVYLSSDLGATFRHIGLPGKNVRVLEVQHNGPQAFLWAGITVPSGEAEGEGCYSRELLGDQDPPEGWQAWTDGWHGGSCRGLAFLETRVMAATHHTGVLLLDAVSAGAAWTLPDVESGLPLQSPGRFEGVDAVAADRRAAQVLAGGERGIFRSRDRGATYEECSRHEFNEEVTLPPTWLFCCGESEIEVTTDASA